MTGKELYMLDRVDVAALRISLKEKSPEEFIQIIVDYRAELPTFTPLSALLLELITSLEDAWNINQEPNDE